MAPWTYSASATTRVAGSATAPSRQVRAAISARSTGPRDVAGGGAEFIRIAAQQHGAAARRNDVGDEPHKLAFEYGPMAAALRHGDGAEKEQERASAQQRVLRGIGRRRRRVAAIDQHGIADADLVAGLEPVFADAHSIDEGPGAGVAIDDLVAAIALPHDAVLPCRSRLRKLDVRGGRAADASLARPQRKPLSEKRSADDYQLRLHGLVGHSLANRGADDRGLSSNPSVHSSERTGSQSARSGPVFKGLRAPVAWHASCIH